MFKDDVDRIWMGGLQDKGHLSEVKIPQLGGAKRKKKALVALGHKILIMCYHIRNESGS